MNTAGGTSCLSPRIRFKDFEGAWETVPLSRYLSVSEERNTGNRYGANDVFSVSREFGIVNQIEFQGRSFAGASLLGYRVIHKGQIAYTKSPLKATPYGILKADKKQSGIVSALYGVYNTTADANFVQTFFENDDRLNAYLRPLVNKGAKNTLLVSDEMALDGLVTFPSLPEQQRIASFFANLDETIAAADARLGKLRQTKAAMLEKMFPRPGQTIPEIRFKGFEGEWRQEKLGKIATLITRKNTTLESNLPLTISAEKGLVSQTSFFNNRVAAQNVAHYYLIYKGEFAYNRSSSDSSPFGTVKRLEDHEKGVLSTLYTVFASRREFVDSNYLSVFFSTALWHRDVRLYAAEGARNHGLLNISAEDFFKTTILLPSSLSEQKRIALFFSEMDALILATEAETKKLRQVKAALLEGMFVQG